MWEPVTLMRHGAAASGPPPVCPSAAICSFLLPYYNFASPKIMRSYRSGLQGQQMHLEKP